MVVLTLAVIAGAGYLVLHRPPAEGQETALLEKAFRNLADRDPDVGHDAEAAVRALGAKAVPQLTEASKSSNRVLAERAQKLLAEMKPPAPVPATVEAALPQEKIEIFEFAMESRGGQAKAADLTTLWVQLRNNGQAPVRVATGLLLDHPKTAVFEVSDGKGLQVAVPAQVYHRQAGEVPALATLPPHETALLFEGGKALVDAVSKPGTYTIRFAYDATEGSDYRKLVTPSAEGALLPPLRLVSNAVTVTVTE